MPKPVGALSFEKLVASKSESSLQEVTHDGRPEAGEKTLGAFFGNDFPESTYHTGVVGGRVKLDSGLNTVEI